MRVYTEKSLLNFEFWAGAISNRNRFSYDEMEQLDAVFEDLYGDEGVDETTINDIMWFEPETLCEWLDLDFDEWLNRPDDYYMNN